jgi:hypothetical protein
MNVVPFPVLTMSSIVPRDCEPVLTLPLPRRRSLQLLEGARGQVLLYLDWVIHEMVDVDNPQAVCMEIIRASNRLMEIAAAFPAAQETHAECCMANADESDHQGACRPDGIAMGESTLRQCRIEGVVFSLSSLCSQIAGGHS